MMKQRIKIDQPNRVFEGIKWGLFFTLMVLSVVYFGGHLIAWFVRWYFGL
jgi:hypothetical protein